MGEAGCRTRELVRISLFRVQDRRAPAISESSITDSVAGNCRRGSATARKTAGRLPFCPEAEAAAVRRYAYGAHQEQGLTCLGAHACDGSVIGPEHPTATV
jgi:hypothetical protein